VACVADKGAIRQGSRDDPRRRETALPIVLEGVALGEQVVDGGGVETRLTVVGKGAVLNRESAATRSATAKAMLPVIAESAILDRQGRETGTIHAIVSVVGDGRVGDGQGCPDPWIPSKPL